MADTFWAASPRSRCSKKHRGIHARWNSDRETRHEYSQCSFLSFQVARRTVCKEHLRTPLGVEIVSAELILPLRVETIHFRGKPTISLMSFGLLFHLRVMWRNSFRIKKTISVILLKNCSFRRRPIQRVAHRKSITIVPKSSHTREVASPTSE